MEKLNPWSPVGFIQKLLPSQAASHAEKTLNRVKEAVEAGGFLQADFGGDPDFESVVVVSNDNDLDELESDMVDLRDPKTCTEIVVDAGDGYLAILLVCGEEIGTTYYVPRDLVPARVLEVVSC